MAAMQRGVLGRSDIAAGEFSASDTAALLATRRAGWRTALPFGPPLLAGAVLALALGTPGSLG